MLLHRETLHVCSEAGLKHNEKAVLLHSALKLKTFMYDFSDNITKSMQILCRNILRKEDEIKLKKEEMLTSKD